MKHKTRIVVWFQVSKLEQSHLHVVMAWHRMFGEDGALNHSEGLPNYEKGCAEKICVTVRGKRAYKVFGEGVWCMCARRVSVHITDSRMWQNNNNNMRFQWRASSSIGLCMILYSVYIVFKTLNGSITIFWTRIDFLWIRFVLLMFYFATMQNNILEAIYSFSFDFMNFPHQVI